MSQTEIKIVAGTLAVVISLILYLLKNRTEETLFLLLFGAGGLAVVYGLVKFVKWAWYN
jgi:hypothetical protein